MISKIQLIRTNHCQEYSAMNIVRPMGRLMPMSHMRLSMLIAMPLPMPIPNIIITFMNILGTNASQQPFTTSTTLQQTHIRSIAHSLNIPLVRPTIIHDPQQQQQQHPLLVRPPPQPNVSQQQNFQNFQNNFPTSQNF